MKKYKIYFEIFGKKMVYETDAKHEVHAKQILLDKIVFHKIEDKTPVTHFKDFGQVFNNFFNSKR